MQQPWTKVNLEAHTRDVLRIQQTVKDGDVRPEPELLNPDRYEVEIIDCETDLVYEYGTRRWYFHQQEHETPYRHRDSTSYDTKDDAMAAWPEMVVWESWPEIDNAPENEGGNRRDCSSEWRSH